jgi:hypothetical protein
MKHPIILLMLLVTAVLAGCAAAPPVHLDPSYWANKPQSVGVIVVKMPKPATLKMGAQGLLDIAINDAMADVLTKHLNSLSLDDFRVGGQAIAAYYSKQGVAAKFIPEELDLSAVSKVKDAQKGYADRDYSSLKAKYGVDQLVVLQVKAAGTIRDYYGFIPTSAPRGYFLCAGSLVDLSNNKLLWTATGVKEVAVEKPWDQPDEGYPHITSAFYQALTTAKTAVVTDLIGAESPKLSMAH